LISASPSSRTHLLLILGLRRATAPPNFSLVKNEASIQTSGRWVAQSSRFEQGLDCSDIRGDQHALRCSRPWSKRWEPYRKFIGQYKIQRKEGGELAEAKDGTLFLQIMEVGLHDGNYPATSPSGKKRKKGPEHHAVSGSESSDHDNSQGKGTTSRLIALVGEITTSEAAEVINELNNPSHGSQGSSSKDDLNPDSATSNPLSGSGSGSGSGTKNNSGSGTSNAKSGEKSISSEGISIGGSTTLAARVVIDQAENVIGDDASGARVSFKDATATAIVIEFLEPTGTRISVVEAKGLENLLRSALMYLPEERMPPSELAKHHWFFDDFKG
jgi:serine/threonine-protein kinase SRPK3